MNWEGDKMIQVENLSKTFKIAKKRTGLRGSIVDLFKREFIQKEAVKDISFNIKQGELVGYIGPNGAGKSTTIKMLCGVLHPDEGKVLVNGIVPFKKRRENNMNIGVVFGQRGQLWRDLAVQDSFTLLKKMYEVSDKDYEKRIDIFNEVLGIKELMPLPVRKLSLGQRMRSEFAAALIHWPKVVYLDEPTIGVDVLTRKKILQFVERLNQEFGTTVILTTHNMHDIEALCNRVILINKGRVIYDGETQALKQIHAGYKKIFINHKNPIGYQDNQLKKSIPDSVQILKRNENQIVLLTEVNDTTFIANVIEQVKMIQPIQDFEVLLPKIEDIIENVYERVSV